jgi:SPX domain protein involved in polyphosphate accumulation
MVQFELTLEKERERAWRDKYLNYKALKKALKVLKESYAADEKLGQSKHAKRRGSYVASMIHSASFSGCVPSR